MSLNRSEAAVNSSSGSAGSDKWSWGRRSQRKRPEEREREGEDPRSEVVPVVGRMDGRVRDAE